MLFDSPGLAVLIGLMIASGSSASAMTSHSLFIGTYTRDGSKGIYSLQLDPRTGALTAPVVAAETQNPSYLALSPDHRFLYAVSEMEQMAAAFAVDAGHTRLTPLQTPQPSHGQAPCHLVVDRTGRTLLVANYHTGVVASLPIRPDGTLGAAGSVIQHTGSSVNPDRQSSPHIHSVTLSPDNRFVLVCDLGLDKIFTYRLDSAAAKLAPADPPFVATAPGAGPRHAAFSRDGRFVFVISEMGSTIVTYAYDAATGALAPRDTQSTLPAGFTGENTAAAIRVHPNGLFVYGSNRGDDSLAVFAFDETAARLTPVEIVPSGGKGPRDFAFSPDGAWLVVAHQYSNSIVVFRVDPQTGRLTRTAVTEEIPTPVCVLFAD
jgi:6-phosphogluconolactonase